MYELLIIGGGAAGLFAAYTAKQSGVQDIAVLESLNNTGGNSAMAGGYIYALDTPQMEGSEHNNVDQELGEALYFHHYDMVEPALLHRWFDETKNTIALLEKWGFSYQLSNLGEGYTHVMADSPGVAWFHKVLVPLAKRLEADGVTFFKKTTVRSIEKDESGRVCGVTATNADGEETRFSAQNVLLACGGFMNNKELLRKYFPMYYTDESFYQVVPAPGNGIDLAMSAGALCNPECTLVKETGMCFRPGPHAPGRIFAMGGSVYVSSCGRRYLNESLWNQNYAANAGLRQKGMHGYAIYSKQTLEAALDATEPFDLKSKRDDYLAYIEKEAAKKTECAYFDTLDEMAAWIGADPAVLKKTVEDYNSYCRTGVDKEFGKPAKYLIPLESGPWLAICIHPMYVDTIGPVVIDEDLRVLDQNRDPIPGLFAAGVIAAGWEGRDYMRFGSALSWSVTSGRMAGYSVAKHSADNGRQQAQV